MLINKEIASFQPLSLITRKGDGYKMERLEVEIAEFVGNYSRKHGYPPTVEELIKTFGILTIMCTMFYVLNLYRIGMIRNSLFFGTGGLKMIPVKSNN